MQASENNIIYGREGVQLNFTCTVKNGIPAATLLWRKDNLTVANGSSDNLSYQCTPTRFDHMKNITCSAFSDLLPTPLSHTIQLDIQYRPYLMIIQRNKGSIVEGESMELCCISNSNPHVQYIAWEKNKSEVALWRQQAATDFDELNKDLCFRIPSVYRNHTGNYTCFAENSIAKSNSSIAINVLYPPDVIVTYAVLEESTILSCIPDGNPDKYTFYDWEHRSDFNEHIRWFNGIRENQLIINKSQHRKSNEDDGVYVCTVSNGVSNKKGNFRQEGQVRVEKSASPVFFADNEPVQIGQYGKIVELTIKVYDKTYNSKVFITKKGTTVRTKTRIENITTHDTFYGVKIRVSGIQYTIRMHLTSSKDFTNYTVEACNDIGCNHFHVLVQSANPPDVMVTSTISKLYCVADGRPDKYTFYDWERKSEFNEHIRYIRGTEKGQLVIDKSQKGKENENDGIYICTVSNGISNLKGKTKQKGQSVIVSHAPPVFVPDNELVQNRQYGKNIKLKIHVYDKSYNCSVLIKMNDTTIKVKAQMEKIITYDTFHRVNITVRGQRYTFELPLTSENDFTRYSAEACNYVGCYYFDIQVQSAYFSYKSEKYCNSGWKIVGSLLGGIIILSICLNIYCLLKRKRLSRMVPEIPLEVQYDEIGIIHGNSAGIQALSNSVQEAETSVDGPTVEETYPHSTSLEQHDSSDNSVQSLSTSLLLGDGYENPYQLIDPADIEIHTYSTVGSYLYQNTIIFPRQRSSRNPNPFIPNEEKRVPWLVIYKTKCANAWT
ncbi:Hypothetical predicted protein [Mytilus galloprovincialis]|uniref:Ig-like domain-containing protein n=1 Tax=Mytilus galloprovincialis TaxID=29158 RepID=A0A8B6G383_MYTGA|nr:Hypothetical predicted protein [Mytilus galloprovincialis]